MTLCEECSGTGTVTVSSFCGKCGGAGEVITYGSDGSEKLETCSTCEDGLIYIERRCSRCGGAGQ